MSEILNLSNHLGTPLFTSSSDLTRSSQSIKDKVYDMLLKIPAGKVTTYGDIAKAYRPAQFLPADRANPA